MQQLTFRAMGCQILAILDDDGAAAAGALSCVPDWFETWEQHLSRFRPNSELSVLNREGYLSAASPIIWTVVQLALAQARETEGLVTPALLGALEAAGYDRSFEILELRSNDATRTCFEQRVSATEPDWQHIECDASSRSIRLPSNVRLDLGGSAKGWAVDEAIRRLAPHGPVLLDAGGDIAVSGPQADGTRWPIGVADPHTPGAHLDLLLLEHGGVATSGRDFRRWQRNGIWQHHLIDPRTMQPAISDVLSATVIGPSTAQCETAAKVVLLRGSQDGLAWLETHPDLAGLVILEDGTVHHSRRLRRYRWQAA